MTRSLSVPRGIGWLASVALILLGSFACIQAGTSSIPPAPVPFRWPEPAFEPARQCRGNVTTAALEQYLGRARLSFWLPGTHHVRLDQRRRCIEVAVDDIGTGRLAELLLRAVAVPRRAILLVLIESLASDEGERRM